MHSRILFKAPWNHLRRSEKKFWITDQKLTASFFWLGVIVLSSSFTLRRCEFMSSIMPLNISSRFWPDWLGLKTTKPIDEFWPHRSVGVLDEGFHVRLVCVSGDTRRLFYLDPKASVQVEEKKIDDIFDEMVARVNHQRKQAKKEIETMTPSQQQEALEFWRGFKDLSVRVAQGCVRQNTWPHIRGSQVLERGRTPYTASLTLHKHHFRSYGSNGTLF